jgi:hypothetical protein
VASSLFFNYNTELGPPYHVLMDTNFINFSIQNKLEIMKAMMDCLYAKCEQQKEHLLFSVRRRSFPSLLD